MRLRSTLWLLLLAACSSLTGDIRVTSRQYADIDLSDLRVYQWSNVTAEVVDTTGTWGQAGLDLGAIGRAAVERELAALGLAPVASGALLRVKLTAVGTRQGASGAAPPADDAADEPPVTEGSLMVEIFHSTTDALVWRGSARSSATKAYTPEESQARIEHAVHEMFARLVP